MNDNRSITKKRAAIITNNLHCERHVQYFATVEKYFIANGWEIAGDFDVNKIVICACGFHDAMYDKIKRTLLEIEKSNFLEKNIILMACLTKTHEADVKRNFKGQVVPFHDEEKLDDIIKAKIPFSNIRPVNMFQLHEKCVYTGTESDYFHIKISEGCLRECTFCVINKAKGYINSVPYEKIAQQVEIALKLDRLKIKLTAEDTFAYGIDKGTTITRLVNRLKTTYPEIELYFGYLHIRWLKKYAQEIIYFCKNGVIKELHIGLQHVNEEMLRSMGRPVVFSEIYDIIREIKSEIPDFYLVADIMVGFPGETDEMFDELIEFFKKDKCFNKVKHFGYSDVKGAPSTKLPGKVPADVITARWDALDKILGQRAYSNQTAENRIDNETFRVTRFEDYSFCKGTFEDEIDEGVIDQELTLSKSQLLKEDKGDFGF